MTRKDCDNSNHPRLFRRGLRSTSRVLVAGIVTAVVMGASTRAQAGSVHLWPSAVVVHNTVRLTDLCELRGFSKQTEKKLSGLTVTSAPPPGGRRIVHMTMIREALAAAGVNLAVTTLRGATRCTVSRPSTASAARTEVRGSLANYGVRGSLADYAGPASKRTYAGAERGSDEAAPNRGEVNRAAYTLRKHVVDWLGARLARYGGRVEVEFGKGVTGALDLTSPPYEFSLRRKGRTELGLVRLEADITVEGKVRQSIDVICNVSFFAPVIVGRRPISRDMTIREADVEVVEMKFTSLDRLSIADTSMVVGRRARRFIPVGDVIRGRDLETIPLVTRNQLVRLVAAVGGVRVETAGKALAAGGLGDVITIRSLDDRRREFEAVITGPGEASVGGRGQTLFATSRSNAG